METISVVGVSKTFGKKTLFKNLNFTSHAGEIIGLTGSNGIGKTTLLKLLCGLIHPDCGTIYLKGIEVHSNRKKYMQDMGAFLEGSRTVYWRLSALQNIIYFSGLKGIFGKRADSQAEKMLRFFDLWDVKHKKVETFSFGMKQRLALACSLTHAPSIIILDEPTSGLDHVSVEMFKTYIRVLAEEKKTIIMAAHDQNIIHDVSNRILRIENGILRGIS